MICDFATDDQARVVPAMIAFLLFVATVLKYDGWLSFEFKNRIQSGIKL